MRDRNWPSRILAGHRWVIGAVTLVALTATVALVTRGLRQDYRLEAFVATSDASYERFRAFLGEFTSNEFALVAIRAAEPFGPEHEAILGELTEAFGRLSAVERCGSLLDLPRWLRAAAGDRLLAHPMLAGNLVSDDRRTAAMLCQMAGEQGDGAVRRETVAAMKAAVAEARERHPDVQIILTGPYVTLIDMYAQVDRDLLVFSVLAFALMTVTLGLLFRNWRPMLFAAFVALTSIVIVLGLTVAAGIVTSLITQMIVILVIVLAVANCVHLAIAAEETRHDRPGAPWADQGALTLRRMLAPCTAVMVTTAAGFASVSMSEIAPVRRFGLLMAGGMLVALLASLVAVVPLHRRKSVAFSTPGRLAGRLASIGRWSVRRAGWCIALFVVGCGVIIAGSSRLRFESDFVKNFRAGSEVRRSYRFIETHLTPLGSMEIVARRRDGGPAATAEGVRLANEVGRQAVADHALVRRALTLADLLTLLMPALPTSDADVAVRLGLLRRLPDGDGLLRNFVNPAGDAQRLNLRCVEGFAVADKLAAAEAIQQAAQASFGGAYDVEVTGLYHFYAQLVAGLLRDQYRSLALTIVAITVVIAVMLRNGRLTLIAMIINLLPVALCLGAMGWCDVPVNMTTAMMLSATLGIAVDDTLHYVYRLRREMAVDGDLLAAIQRTHASVGKACVFTTVVIAGGFSILLLSQFLPTAYFGGLVGFTMVGALAADLLLLPALLATIGGTISRPADRRPSGARTP